MPSLTFRSFTSATLLLVSTASFSQQKLDIVEIMGQFVQADYAASKCLKPDQQTISKFNSNLKVVSARAMEEMLKRKPGATEQQVTEFFKKASDTVQARISEVIQDKGCSDPRIQDLLKRYDIQANLKF